MEHILRNDGRYIELGEAIKLAISRPSYHRMLDFSCCPLLSLLTVSGKIGDCECYKSGGLQLSENLVNQNRTQHMAVYFLIETY